MKPLRAEGLQIVRYSPAERRWFEPRKVWAGEDAIIRFGKYPEDYGPWTGTDLAVGNLTQDLVARGDATGYGYWKRVTAGLMTHPAGKGSDALPNGSGELSYEGMLDYLRRLRVYLYTGTRPASYTLGLIEAMLSGVPVVSIDKASWGAEWGGEDLFEGDEIAPLSFPDLYETRRVIRELLEDEDFARDVSYRSREFALGRFCIEAIAPQWAEFLA
jgi:glycosyltransferase involved in cell wall biosynthesis